MSREAPAVDGTPDSYHVSIKWIDASGDIRSDGYRVLFADYLDAETEALVVALGAASNASLYSVEVTEEYYSTPQVSNASAADRPSVFSNVVLHYKNTTNDSRRVYVPAPTTTCFEADSDNPNTGSTPLANTLTAADAIFTDFSAISARYTERSEINEKQRI